MPGCPSGRGAGDQYSMTLACRESELCHNPTGAVGKIEQKQRKQLENELNHSEDSRRHTASVGHFWQRAFGQPLSRICPAMMWPTRFAISSRGTLRSCPRVGSVGISPTLVVGGELNQHKSGGESLTSWASFWGVARLPSGVRLVGPTLLVLGRQGHDDPSTRRLGGPSPRSAA